MEVLDMCLQPDAWNCCREGWWWIALTIVGITMAGTAGGRVTTTLADTAARGPAHTFFLITAVIKKREGNAPAGFAASHTTWALQA